MLTYKVIEINTVTEEELETAINAWVKQGWTFDGIHFAMREASKGRQWHLYFLQKMMTISDY